MKLVVFTLACGICLQAAPALAQTADQLAGMCDFVQTGMIHRDENFGSMIAGPPNTDGQYPLARPYSWPYAGCAASKGTRWALICAWYIDGIASAQQAQRSLNTVGDQVTACIGSGYNRSLNADGYLVFSLEGKDRVEAVIHAVDGKYVLTIGVVGPY